jgi:hypothetical protein
MSVIVSEAIRRSKFIQRVVFTYTPLRERPYCVHHLFPAYISLSAVGRPRIRPFRFTLGQYYNYTSRSVGPSSSRLCPIQNCSHDSDSEAADVGFIRYE